jgi:hypothetical protein
MRTKELGGAPFTENANHSSGQIITSTNHRKEWTFNDKGDAPAYDG